VDHPAGEARVIAKIIEDLMHSDAGFAKMWIELLVLYPKPDIPASVFDSDAAKHGRNARYAALAIAAPKLRCRVCPHRSP
jgi:hypothetical protein